MCAPTATGDERAKCLMVRIFGNADRHRTINIHRRVRLRETRGVAPIFRDERVRRLVPRPSPHYCQPPNVPANPSTAATPPSRPNELVAREQRPSPYKIDHSVELLHSRTYERPASRRAIKCQAISRRPYYWSAASIFVTQNKKLIKIYSFPNF